MNLRWLLGNYADPQYELTSQEQWALSKAAHKEHLTWGRFSMWTLLVVIAPTLLVFKFALPVTLKWLGMDGQDMPYFIGCAIIVILFWPWSAWAYRRLYTKPIRRAMRDAGHDVCVGCGYLLDGLADDAVVCPECGAGREPAA